MEDSRQNPTAYLLTTVEQKLLEALLDPRNRLKSVSEKCRIAEINRDSYYRLLKKSEFVTYYKDFVRELIVHEIGPLVNTCIREALRGSHQHMRIALSMADIYHERKEVTGKNGEPVKVQHSVKDLIKEIMDTSADLVKE